MIRRITLKQILISLLGGILFLTSCGQAPTNNIPTPLISATESNTIQNPTSSPLPTKTPRERANEPTITPRPPTPLPTIPTFTPTFDVSTILIVTPAPRAECPKENSSLSPNLTDPHNFPLDKQQILDSLDSGVSIDSIANAINSPGYSPSILSADVTGDSAPELLLINSEPIYHLYIYTCAQGKYILIFPEINYFGYDTEIVATKDLNADDIPEIIVEHRGCMGNGCYSIYILEWNGAEFQVMNSDSKYGENMDGLLKVETKDLNNDGIFEILMTGGVPALGAYIIGPPWRVETKTLAWNGRVYALKSVKYEPAEFRFQAIQDGDGATLNGNYDEAMKSYTDVIFSDKLDWWSKERQADTIVMLSNDGYKVLGTPTPGTPDLTEYPRLAAYASYRIMLLHLMQGNESDADAVYKTLQHKFGSDAYARPYVEMATAFWDTYQSAHKMYDGCAAAIQYAAEHPEILTPLGSDYHGSQSHIYEPADVCPFR